MIGGEPRIHLTKEEILKHCTAWDIYRFYLGDFPLGEKICNPLRGESSPSMVITPRDGYITHKDFGCDYYRGDCFHLVMQVYGCNYDDALKFINRDLRLGIGESNPQTGDKVITWKQPKIEIRQPPKIQVITRNYNQDELAWWNLYHQDKTDLRRENIYVPREIYRNHKRLHIPNGDLIFCYYYPQTHQWKIYRPLKGKSTKYTKLQDRKWDSNVNFDASDGLELITPGSRIGMLTKSKKDRMVIRKATGIESICVVQAEDPACLTDEALAHIKNNSDIQLAVSDNDQKGKEFSWWLTKNHGYKHCNPPDEYLNYDPSMSDFADMGRYLGLDSVTQHFKNKGFI